MNILLIGTNGREHALAWKLLQSARVKQIFVAADTGMVEVLRRSHPDRVQVFKWRENEDDTQELIRFAIQHAINLVVIGPEAPLAAGISDALRGAHIPVFGPSQAAARIESSKAFSKDFMKRHRIPTAQYALFTEYKQACQYLKTLIHPFVIKVSGLAAGKGVFLPESPSEAEEILKTCLVEKYFGEAGTEVVIEERLSGPELSLLCFTDGRTVRVMPPARDYKRLFAQNKGPNTGGMGVIAPVALPEAVSIEHLVKTVLQPTVDGLRLEKSLFQGVLYAGLILTEQGPKVLEFNARFGDPETQVLMPLLQSELLEILEACTVDSGHLESLDIQWKSQHAICVVLASQGYPEQRSAPVPIQGEAGVDHATCLFHAGTRYQADQLLSVGGRVLNVVALGDTQEEARQQAYHRVNQLSFPGMQYRHDIGQ